MEATTKGGGEPDSTVFAMQNLSQMLPKWLVPVAAVALASFSVIYLFFWRIPHVTKPLLVIAMSACPAVTSGMHRITSDFGIGFDASEKWFTVHRILQDLPPGNWYVIKLNDADANMEVWRDGDVFRDLKTTYPIFSEHIEERNIRDTKGRVLGTAVGVICKAGSGGDTSDFPAEMLRGINLRLRNKQTFWIKLSIQRVFRRTNHKASG
jgi:hypothetical protein